MSVWYLPGIRTRTPALPFAKARLKASWKPAGYPKELNDFTAHLQKKQLDRGLQWKEIARQLGVHSTTVTNWMKKRTQPDLRCLPKVIRWLGYDPRPESRTIGQRIVYYREGEGISQSKLAAQLRVDPSTLARWERDDRTPTGEFLERVRAVVTMEQLKGSPGR